MEKMAESASSASTSRFLIVGGGSGGLNRPRPSCCGLARPGSGHPGARQPFHAYQSWTRAGAVCWALEPDPPFRWQRDPGLGLSGFRAAPASFDPGPPGDHGPPAKPSATEPCWWWPWVSSSIESDQRAAGGTRQLRLHSATYSRATSRTTGRAIRSFKGGTAVFSHLPPRSKRRCLPRKVMFLAMTSSRPPAVWRGTAPGDLLPALAHLYPVKGLQRHGFEPRRGAPGVGPVCPTT